MPRMNTNCSCNQPSSSVTTAPRSRRPLHPAMEALEGRLVLSTIVVNTVVDQTDLPTSSTISLRDAVTRADQSTSPTTISFDPKVFAAAQTIVLNGNALQFNGNTTTTITGPGAGLTVSGNNKSQVFVIEPGVSATISGLTISHGNGSANLGPRPGGGGIDNGGNLTLVNSTVSHNSSSSDNGGIENYGKMTLTNVSVSGNSAPGGETGGIANEPGATMTLTDATVSGNASTERIGGIFNGGVMTMINSTVSGNTVSAGGLAGIDNERGGMLKLTDSTVSGNIAAGSAAGVYDGGDSSSILTNVTISGNTATDGGAGGGIYVDSGGSVKLSDCTIADNTSSGGGGIDNSSGSTVMLGNTIVADDSGAASSPDVAGKLVSYGHNLFGNLAGGSGFAQTDFVGLASLTPLGNYGGPTQTQVPLPGSPVVGEGLVALIPPGVTTDQRGFPRIVGGNVDIGAVEQQAFITGTVFNDANGDGTQDHGEAGLAGVQVYADLGNVGYFVSGDPTTMTNTSGAYTLSGLAAGNYIIRQVLPSRYAQTAPGSGFGHHVTVSAGQTLSGENFGDKATATPTATITGTVFNDANGDGIQDNGEAGLPGVQVYADLGNVGYFVTGDPTTMSSAAGGYSLSGLIAGNYIIRQVRPLGDAQTAPASELGRHVSVSAGQTLSGQNFGDSSAAAPPAAITGTVFNDANGDGTQDDGETGLAGVQVYLDLGNVGYFVTGDPTTLTDVTGGYTLSGLAAGNYIVRQALPLGFVQTTPANGFGHHVTVTAGQALSGQSFGDKA